MTTSFVSPALMLKSSILSDWADALVKAVTIIKRSIENHLKIVLLSIINYLKVNKLFCFKGTNYRNNLPLTHYYIYKC